MTILLEELLAAGHTGAEYDAWLINIGKGDQFGKGFVEINPNSKIPALADHAPVDGGKPVRLFRSASIMTYLAEKFGAFLPTDPRARADAQLAVLPAVRPRFVGGGFGHFFSYAPMKIQYAIDRYAMEAKRQLDVLNRQLAENVRLRQRIHHRRHGDLALVRPFGTGQILSGCRHISVDARIQERSALGKAARRTPGS